MAVGGYSVLAAADPGGDDPRLTSDPTTSASNCTSASSSPPTSPTTTYLALSDQTFTPLSMPDTTSGSVADMLSNASRAGSTCGNDKTEADRGASRHKGYQNLGQTAAATSDLAKAGVEAREKIPHRATDDHPWGITADKRPDLEVGMSQFERDERWNSENDNLKAGAVVVAGSLAPADVAHQLTEDATVTAAAARGRGYDLVSSKNNGLGHPGLQSKAVLPGPASETRNTGSNSQGLSGTEDIAIDEAAKENPNENCAGQSLVGEADALHHQQTQDTVPPLAPVLQSIVNAASVTGENFPLRPIRPKIAVDTSSKAQSFDPSLIPLSSASSATNSAIVRPKPNYAPLQQQYQSSPLFTTGTSHPLPDRPPIVRTTSNSSVPIQHPIPDLNTRSGAYTGNIAVLEATAERFSMTSSIEDAIRDAHNELKRSDSRRSSMLRANSERRAASETASIHSVDRVPPLPSLSRQSSILGINNTARCGGYSPGGYILSPSHSLSNASTRLRSGSKASSLGAPPFVPPLVTKNTNMETGGSNPITVTSGDSGNGPDFSVMSRHGTGKGSVRSIRSAVSGKLSLAGIAELEPPLALTQEALDEADRMAARGEGHEDDDMIRASAHQHVDPEFAEEEDEDVMVTPQAGPARPLLDGALTDPAPPVPPQIDFDSNGQHEQHQYQAQSQQYQPYRLSGERPTTAGSGQTYEEAEMAFADFDGVHSDPQMAGFPEPIPAPTFVPPPVPMHAPTVMQQQSSTELAENQHNAAFPTRRLQPQARASRPTSYFDPTTGQQMLYYPARVPAILNLPPKLSKGSRTAANAIRNNKRRSQVMSALMSPNPQDQRGSRVWLPDPLEDAGQFGSPLMDTVGEGEEKKSETGAGAATTGPDLDLGGLNDSQLQLGLPGSQPATSPGHQEPRRSLRRPARLRNAEKRKTQNMSALEGLPPQLRASAFFDLPAVETPRIAIKDGSAMRTLDSILDAAAAAPVSAFTDHAFAGKLGSEVYGKKKKMASKASPKEPEEPLAPPGPKKLQKRASREMLAAVQEADAKRRSSMLSVLGRGRDGEGSLDVDGRKRASSSPHVDQEVATSPNVLAPDEDDEEEEEDEEDADHEAYQGAPTTLLAELQLRKQQQAMRTRPVHHSTGLHSTLLELDAVHQVESKARKGKRVHLAWEDPANNNEEESDDEEVPLALLAAAKANGNRSTMDISAVMDEVNRPLGLMERRELEDNEPLSQRRDRLQGKETGPNPVTLNRLQQRMSTMNLTMANGVGAAHARTQSRLTLPLGNGEEMHQEDEGEPSEPEVEGETLASRKQRLAVENPLPRARPVSGLFSSELLSQFGGPEEEEEKKKKETSIADSPNKKSTAGNEATTPVPEEEETLGQRRRRLQAEREARAREMGGHLPAGRPSLLPVGSMPTMQHLRTASNPDPAAANGLSRRLDMSGILSAHPLGSQAPVQDPRAAEKARREADAARAQTEREVKMAMLRAQMPGALKDPAVGARSGGFSGGRFNDGLGGGVAQQYQQQRQQQRQSQMLQHRQSMMSLGAETAFGGYGGNAYGAGAGYGVQAGLPLSQSYGTGVGVGVGYGAMQQNMHMNMGMNGYSAGYGMQPAQGHLDMVERWRQSIQP